VMDYLTERESERTREIESVCNGAFFAYTNMITFGCVFRFPLSFSMCACVSEGSFVCVFLDVCICVTKHFHGLFSV